MDQPTIMPLWERSTNDVMNRVHAIVSPNLALTKVDLCSGSCRTMDQIELGSRRAKTCLTTEQCMSHILFYFIYFEKQIDKYILRQLCRENSMTNS